MVKENLFSPLPCPVELPKSGSGDQTRLDVNLLSVTLLIGDKTLSRISNAKQQLQ